MDFSIINQAELCSIPMAFSRQYQYGRFMSAIDDFRKIVDMATNKVGSLNKLATGAGVDYGSLHKWINNNQKSLNFETVAKILDHLGVPLMPQAGSLEAGRDVCFVSAKIVQAGEKLSPPDAENYLAAPLVGEVGAGNGYVAQEQVESWVLVYKDQKVIGTKRDLIAVMLGDHSTSMEPLLHPKDVVLVDRSDKKVGRGGRIMLVKDPEDNGMIKRVAFNEVDGDMKVIYYSDNAAYNPPLVYSLKHDFYGEESNAIVGHVIWAWSDISSR